MTVTIKKNPVEARQGGSGLRMPVVLGLSVLLIIVAFAAIYGFTTIFGAHQ